MPFPTLSHMDGSAGRNAEPKRPRFACRICSVPNATFLYGAIVCSACAGFFARTMRRDGADRYKCPMPKPCPMHYTVRRRCRACRLQKCLDKGMRLKRQEFRSDLCQEQPIEAAEPNASARPSVIVSNLQNNAQQRPSVIVRRTCNAPCRTNEPERNDRDGFTKQRCNAYAEASAPFTTALPFLSYSGGIRVKHNVYIDHQPLFQ